MILVAFCSNFEMIFSINIFNMIKIILTWDWLSEFIVRFLLSLVICHRITTYHYVAFMFSSWWLGWVIAWLLRVTIYKYNNDIIYLDLNYVWYWPLNEPKLNPFFIDDPCFWYGYPFLYGNYLWFVVCALNLVFLSTHVPLYWCGICALLLKLSV